MQSLTRKTLDTIAMEYPIVRSALAAKSPEELWELCGNLPFKAIRTSEGDYVERHFLFEAPARAPAFGYLHHWLSGDGDRELHNHPWDLATTTVLHGGYSQYLMVNSNTSEKPETIVQHFSKGDRQDISGETFHQIIETIPGTWSLFIHGPWTKPWGFLEESGAGWQHRIHPSDPDPRWWLDAPLAKHAPNRAIPKHIAREPTIEA